jgi:hypothetical protein
MIDMLAMKALGAVAAVAALSGCAAVNRTRPQDMTVPEHEQAAQADLRKSEEASTGAATGARGAAFQRYSAQRHRELAGEHAGAAEARRKEVAAICGEADASKPLAAMKIAAVEPIRERQHYARGYSPNQLKGARIALQVDEGVAQAARSVECEAARAAALVGPVDAASPFAVPAATAVVRPQAPGIVVEIRGDSDEVAEEILRRATALAQVARSAR